MTKQSICSLFNCTPEQLQRQYKANANTLAAMRDKAIKTGKKQGNMSADQLAVHATRYSELAK